jgi:lysophospholipase L1-like esterase
MNDLDIPGMVRAIRLLAFTTVVLVAFSACADTTSDNGAANRESRPMLPADRSVPVTYVAMGDSTVSGVGATSPNRNYVSRLHVRLQEVYPGATVTNLGVPAATSADVLQSQVPIVLARQPHLITLSVGPNDIILGHDLQSFDQNVATILRTLQHETDAIVVVNLLPDLTMAPIFQGAAREEFARRTVEFNQVLERRAQEHGVVLVDLYSASQQPELAPDLVGDDDYHPSDEGYALWAEFMWEGIEARIPR